MERSSVTTVTNKTVSHIREKIWGGKLIVKMEVPEHYISGTEPPKPGYKVLSRNTYLDFHNEAANELFKSYTIGSELWFGFKDKPLHWHVPFGVLVDTYHGLNIKVPLELTVHYRTPPFDKIIYNNVKLADVPTTSYPLTGLRTVRDHYKHSVKEAAQIRFGTTNVIMLNTKAEEWDQLFDVIKGGRDYMEKYEKIFNKIWFCSDLKIRGVPLRIFITDYDNLIQKGAPIIDEEGKEILLGDCLKKLFPKVRFHWDKESDEKGKQYQVISHGILLEYDYTMSFLSETFYALDGFVYISLYCPNVNL